MAETFISGAPTNPGAATEALLYTAPGSLNYSLVLSLVCANQDNSVPDTITIRKLLTGEGATGVANRELVAELDIPAKESFFFSEKVVLGPNESISVEALNGTVVFTLSLLQSTP